MKRAHDGVSRNPHAKRILDLWRQGMQATAIAREIGHGQTRNSVLGVVFRAGEQRKSEAPLWRPPPADGAATSTCCFIEGDMFVIDDQGFRRRSTGRYCGAPAMPGKSYCPEHYERCTRREAS